VLAPSPLASVEIGERDDAPSVFVGEPRNPCTAICDGDNPRVEGGMRHRIRLGNVLRGAWGPSQSFPNQRRRSGKSDTNRPASSEARAVGMSSDSPCPASLCPKSQVKSSIARASSSISSSLPSPWNRHMPVCTSALTVAASSPSLGRRPDQMSQGVINHVRRSLPRARASSSANSATLGSSGGYRNARGKLPQTLTRRETYSVVPPTEAAALDPPRVVTM
jgi:hypothetical protein